MHDQRRMSAWHVQRWCSTLDVRCILVENVAEFRDWGPLLPTGRPDPEQKGLYFQAWIQALWAMGYHAEWRLLNAADYGDATTRTRFFLQARKDGQPIRWPEPSHSPTGEDDMFGGRPRWRAAREVIDWDRPGASLLTRKRPLSVKTRMRIARGLARFGGPLAQAYIDLLDLPAEAAPTPVGAGGPAPFVSPFRNNSRPRGAGEPLPTICAHSNHMSIVTPSAEPFVTVSRTNNVPRSTDEPLPTITTSPAMFVVEPSAKPFILGQRSDSEPRAIDRPTPTITTVSRIAVVEASAEPFVLGQQSCSAPRPADEPLPTGCTAGAIALIDPTIIPYYGTGVAAPVDAPLPAVTSRGGGELVEPIVVKVNHGEGGGWGRDIDEPLPTVTATQRGLAVVETTAQAHAAADVDPRRLVLIDGVPHVLDIRFRMLSNRELARAMSFDDDGEYHFEGNIGEVTKQIGNAVACRTAEALVVAILGGEA